MKTFEERKAAVETRAKFDLAVLEEKESIQKQVDALDKQIELERGTIAASRIAIKHLLTERELLRPTHKRTSKTETSEEK